MAMEASNSMRKTVARIQRLNAERQEIRRHERQHRCFVVRREYTPHGRLKLMCEPRTGGRDLLVVAHNLWPTVAECVKSSDGLPRLRYLDEEVLDPNERRWAEKVKETILFEEHGGRFRATGEYRPRTRSGRRYLARFVHWMESRHPDRLWVGTEAKPRSGSAAPLRKGMYYERMVAEYFQSKGYFVLRSYGSLGPVDLVAIPLKSRGRKKGRPILLIQVKGKSGLSASARASLRLLARRVPLNVKVRLWRYGVFPPLRSIEV